MSTEHKNEKLKMFNREKLNQVCEELYKQGYAITPQHVVGVLTVDKPEKDEA
jgi:hypothetical protein